MAPRRSRLHAGWQCSAALGLLQTASAHAQTPANVDPHVHATVTTTPPRVHLEWSAMTGTTAYALSRRDDPSAPFDVVAGAVPGSATSWDDDTVSAGRTYEYVLERIPQAGGAHGFAYLEAGLDAPFTDDPGVVLLVVDRVNAAALAAPLERLERDLREDGWDVVRTAVDPAATPPAVRAEVQRMAREAGPRARALFLLGRVPRAFSGLINPDGHADHRGAWPADGYYADLDGDWPDARNLGGAGTFANMAGDGKFDPSQFPSALELATGRVDASAMPAFAAAGDEAALLARYLDHDHAYRAGEVGVRPRAFVADGFGLLGGEAPARVGYRDATALFGAEAEGGAPFLDALEDPSGGYALALGSGPGTPNSAGGIATTADLATRAPRAVFLGLFGSYFGDWSYPDDLLRAAILTRGTALATTWFARPYAHLHPLAALRSFGETFLRTANNGGEYDSGVAAASVHQALLGDPTLRLFVTRAPTGLRATATPEGVRLEWQAAPGTPVGYHVYRRATGATEPAARITDSPVAATVYTDRGAAPGVSFTYRLVAVERVTNGSGTFFNHSPGVFVQATGAPVGAEPASVDGSGDGGADAGRSGSNGGCGCRTEVPAHGSRAALGGTALALWFASRLRRRASKR